MDDTLWTRLVDAHGRTPAHAPRALPEHAPIAAILACSDARVPPSIVFDQPAGSLFVIRIAGNTATPAALASLDFAVEQLGVELVVVLGHSGCGAVQAAAAGVCDGHLAPIVAPICELARANPDATLGELVERNVEHTVGQLLAHDGPTGEAARTGSILVRGAVHDLYTGALVHLDPASPYSPPTQTEHPHSLETT